MNPNPAARMAAIEPFHVMDVMTRASALEGEGRRIIHMEVGEPDFATPEPICAAAQAVLAAGRMPYTLAFGLPALREAIARFYRERYGVALPVERVIVTAGSSAALLMVMGVLVNPGDEVLMTDPGYPCNRQFARLVGGEPAALPVDAAGGWQPTAAQIDAAWGPRTRAVLIATPANPTGATVSPAALHQIADVARRRGGALIVDEIYQGLTYAGEAHSALALGEDVFVINSFSKTWSMTGWRLGWLIAPPRFVREIEKLAQNLYICPPTLPQHAALAAFAPETMAIVEARRKEFRARRDYFVPALRELGFDVPLVPQGAFYVYAGCERFTRDSFAFALDLLDRAGVAATPGLDFGANRPQAFLRFAYTTGIDNLREAVERMRTHLADAR